MTNVEQSTSVEVSIPLFSYTDAGLKTVSDLMVISGRNRLASGC